MPNNSLMAFTSATVYFNSMLTSYIPFHPYSPANHSPTDALSVQTQWLHVTSHHSAVQVAHIARVLRGVLQLHAHLVCTLPSLPLLQIAHLRMPSLRRLNGLRHFTP